MTTDNLLPEAWHRLNTTSLFGLAIINAKKPSLETAPFKSEAKKAAEDAVAEEGRKFLAAEAAGEG